MNEAVISQLVDMGFPINACKRAAFNSNNDLEAAMNWLCSHIDDADYNTGTFYKAVRFFNYFLEEAQLSKAVRSKVL